MTRNMFETGTRVALAVATAVSAVALSGRGNEYTHAQTLPDAIVTLPSGCVDVRSGSPAQGMLKYVFGNDGGDSLLESATDVQIRVGRDAIGTILLNEQAIGPYSGRWHMENDVSFPGGKRGSDLLGATIRVI